MIFLNLIFICRNLLPSGIKCVEKVELNLSFDDEMTIEGCTLECICIIQKRVSEIVQRRPFDYIFLAGWGTSCLLNHMVGNFFVICFYSNLSLNI